MDLDPDWYSAKMLDPDSNTANKTPVFQRIGIQNLQSGLISIVADPNSISSVDPDPDTVRKEENG